MTEESQRIPVAEKIAYGLGDTATNLVWRTLMVFLGFFYTDVFGLPSAAVGTLMLVSRFGDGISDLLMGAIADRTTTRWGKFRPWILWMAIPFGVMAVLTFTTPNLGDTGKLLYAYITYNGLILVFTASNVPYSAMTGVMSADPGERTKLSSYRFVGAFAGALLTQGLNRSAGGVVRSRRCDGRLSVDHGVVCGVGGGDVFGDLCPDERAGAGTAAKSAQPEGRSR